MQEIVLDLPMPPSVNRIWRQRRGGSKPYLAERYRAWLKEAGQLYMAQRAGKGWTCIEGDFRIELVLDRKKARGGDVDNRLKATADFAQKAGIIANDKNCIGGSFGWGEAPLGARVRFIPVADR